MGKNVESGQDIHYGNYQHCIMRQARTWNPERKEKIGRPKKHTLCWNLEAHMEKMNSN